MTVFIGKYSSFVHGSRVPYFGSIEAKFNHPHLMFVAYLLGIMSIFK